MYIILYIPNFFLLMVRNGFLFSSVGVLCTFLWFLIQVVTLLTGAFSVSLPLIKVVILGCVAMGIPPPYQTAFGGICSGCFSSGFPWCDQQSGAGRFSKWFCKELVCEQSLAPTACWASHGDRIELFGWLLFSWKSVSFSLLPVSPVVQCFVFIRLRLGCPAPTKLDQLSVLPHP
jgi:hypothetical protein